MGRRRIGWFLIGFAAACLLSALLRPSEARAEEPSEPAGESYSTGPSAPSKGRVGEPDVDDAYAAPGIPPSIPADDPAETPEEQDGLDPAPRDGQRAVIQDGDPNFPGDQPLLRDGIIDVGEPAPPEDGTDPSVVDTRSTDDIAIFENPPAGYDPLLFQVEDLDPIIDNRAVRRIGTLDPYDPVGIKVGNFVFFPELEMGGSWYSNVFRSPNPQSDWALDVLPSMRLVSNWARHALEFRTTGDLSYFGDSDSENDKGFLLESRGRLDIARRTNVQGLLSRERTQESRSALDARSVGTRANQTVDRAEAALNHRFNRLSLQLRGSASDYTFGDVENLSLKTSNADRDYTAYEETIRAAWEFKPTLSVFTEVAVNQRNYGLPAATDNINRSSDGERYRAGLSFGNTGRILRGEVSLGYGVQDPDDPRLRSIDGLIVDANTTWRVTETTSLLFNARSDVSETTTNNVGGAMYRYAGIEARHAFQRNLVGSAGLSFSKQSSQDGIIDEREVRATLGLEYFLNRETVFFGRYAHTDLNAVGTTSDYASDEVHFGMKLRR